MNTRLLIPVLCLGLNPAWADFSNSTMTLHPGIPFGPPYIVEVTGEWPTDCHPGEQKPVITEYTGDTALIEFEIIVEHVTCNEVDTPYRVLVDFSDVVDDAPTSVDVEITMRYGGEEITETFLLSCAFVDPCPEHEDVWPEPGLWYSDELPLQGLLLARQDKRMAAYPLTYDEDGSSTWSIAAGGIRRNTFFAELLDTSGPCNGCPTIGTPPPPGTTPVERMTLLMDSEGVIQYKLDDGPFVAHRPLVFGYGTVDLGGDPPVKIPDLTGRWALAESDVGVLPNGSISPSAVLPHVFDLALIGAFGTGNEELLHADYDLFDIEGDEYSTMRCRYDMGMVCTIENPDFDDGSHNVIVRALSPGRLDLMDAGPYLAVGIPARGAAVRVD